LAGAAALEIEDQADSLRLASEAVPLMAFTALPYSIQGGKAFIARSASKARTAPPIIMPFRLKTTLKFHVIP
jgi:hypothetical protein